MRIPKIYDGRNKTFFFYSFEGFRNRVGASVTPSSVPPSGVLFRRSPQLGGRQRQAVSDLRSGDHHAAGQHLRAHAVRQQPDSGKPHRSDGAADHQRRQATDRSQRCQPQCRARRAMSATTTSASVPLIRRMTNTASRSISRSGSKHHLSFYWGHTWDVDTYGPTGPPGLPAPLAGNPGFNKSNVYRAEPRLDDLAERLEPADISAQTFPAESRIVWNRGRIAAVLRPAHRQRRVEVQGLHSQLSGLQHQLPAGRHRRFCGLGNRGAQRVRQLGLRGQGRFDQDLRQAYIQRRRVLRRQPVCRLRPAERRRQRQLCAERHVRSALDEYQHRRRQRLRFVPAGPGQQLQLSIRRDTWKLITGRARFTSRTTGASRTG